MRSDVKLGMVGTLIVVLVGGGYFLTRDKDQDVVPLGSQPAAQSDSLKTVADQPAKSASRSSSSPVSRPGGRRVVDASKNSKSPAEADRTKPLPQPKSERPVSSGPRDRTASRDGAANIPKTTKATGNRGPFATGSDTGKATVDKKYASSSAGHPAGSPVATPGKLSKRNVGGLKAVEGKSGRASSRRLSGDKPLPRRSPSPDSKMARDANDQHRVQRGDTMASLATEYYGNEKYARFLLDANPRITDPKQLKVGMIVQIPPAPEGGLPPARSAHASKRSAPKPARSSRTYTVKAGDTFYGIARDKLGDATKWKELLALNEKLVNGDPKSLRPGQVLALP